MNSQSALSNLNFSSKENARRNNILILKNIRFYNCAIIFLRNSELLVKTKEEQVVSLNAESMCYIEKNTVIDIKLHVLDAGIPYEIFYIDSNILNCICKVMEPLLLAPQKASYRRPRVFSCQVDGTDTKIFGDLIKNDVPQYRQVYKITYLLSKVSDIESLVYSLSVSTDTTFTEKLKALIESDISKPWRLLDIAGILHMSEVSVRKKLERESNNFNKLLLDIRMHHAAKLITTTEKHINIIAHEVGYVSPSYFISNFKRYYGMTPKQFSLKVKR